MSIIDPLACGFANIFCYNTFTNKSTLKKDPSKNLTCYKSQLVHHQYDIFLSTFSLSSQSVTYDQFKENFKNIVGNIQTLGKKHPLKKRHVMDMFSLGNWLDLKDRQLKHTKFDCKGCLENEKWKDALAILPVRGFLHQAKAKKAGLIEKQVLQDKTKSILSELNNNFCNKYHTTFTKQVKRVLEIPKPRDIAKSIKTDIENQWEKTCVERYVKLF